LKLEQKQSPVDGNNPTRLKGIRWVVSIRWRQNSKLFFTNLAMKGLTVRTGVIILALFVFLPPWAFSQTWQYHSTARFIIAYSPSEKKLATQVLGELQIQQETLLRQLQFQPKRAITVYLCPTQAAFDRVTGGVVPHWGEAAADPAQWRIFLKSPAASSRKELDWQTIKHELAHLVLAEIADPGHLPRWFNEGAAILLAGETDHVDPLAISRAMTTNSLVTFDEIEALLSFPNEQAALAYSESYHAVKLLLRRHGAEALYQFASALAVHSDARLAFRAAFAEDLWDFEVAYFDHLRRNFRWYVLLDETLLWSGVILALVVAGYFVTRWRNRKKVQEWEQEEPAPPTNVDAPRDDE
jgi:hypothetical protein